MDIFSIVGLLGALAFFVFGVVFDQATMSVNMGLIMNFLDVPSTLLVVGPTVMSLMLMFPAKAIASFPKMVGKVFMPQKFNPQSYITEITEIAQDVRKNGLLSIDDKISTYKDDFMRKGLQLAVDSTDPEMLRDIMETELAFMMDRHKIGGQICERGAAMAPAFGMVATLVGLINMLANMDDPDSLMGNMAMAMITTIYGCLLANVVFLPFANKMQKRSEEEVLCKQIVIEGVISIVNGENPTQIKEKLVSYIPPSMREFSSKGGASDGGD